MNKRFLYFFGVILSVFFSVTPSDGVIVDDRCIFKVVYAPAHPELVLSPCSFTGHSCCLMKSYYVLNSRYDATFLVEDDDYDAGDNTNDDSDDDYIIDDGGEIQEIAVAENDADSGYDGGDEEGD